MQTRFNNKYKCYKKKCAHKWEELKQDAAYDGECPKCGARHCSPESKEIKNLNQ